MLRVTREYQPTNRRVTKSPAATASPPDGFRCSSLRKMKSKAVNLSPLDKKSAISTRELTCAEPLTFSITERATRRQVQRKAHWPGAAASAVAIKARLNRLLPVQ